MTIEERQKEIERLREEYKTAMPFEKKLLEMKGKALKIAQEIAIKKRTKLV